MWLEWKEGRGSNVAGVAGRFLAAWSLALLLVGAVFGFGLGVLSWSDEFRVVLERLHSKIFFGYWELVFSLVLMSIHWIWWAYAPKAGWGLRILRMCLPLLSGTNLLYHFSFLFVVISELVRAPQSSGDVIDAAAFREIMMQGAIYTRALHFTLAAIAVSGVMLIVFALCRPQQTAEDDGGNLVARWGASIALLTSLLQIPVGIWVLSELPMVAQTKFLGQDMLASGLLITSIVMAFYLMHQLAAITFGDTEPKTLRRAIGLMFVVILLMTGVLELSQNFASQVSEEFVWFVRF